MKVLEKNDFYLESVRKNAVIKNDKIIDDYIWVKLKDEQPVPNFVQAEKPVFIVIKLKYMTIKSSKLTDVTKIFDLYRVATGYMKIF